MSKLTKIKNWAIDNDFEIDYISNGIKIITDHMIFEAKLYNSETDCYGRLIGQSKGLYVLDYEANIMHPNYRYRGYKATTQQDAINWIENKIIKSLS